MPLRADAVVHVEHRVGRGVEIPGLDHAGRAAALHQHHGVVLDRQVLRPVGHHRARNGQFGARQQHPAQVDEVDAQVQQRAAPRGRAVDHPGHVLLVVAVHHAADELEHEVLQRLFVSNLPDGVDDRAVAEHHRHGGEHARRGGAVGDVMRLRRVQRARLLHGEGDAAVDQEAGFLRHVAVPPQGEGEVGLQPGAHLFVVGEGWAFGFRRGRFGAGHVGIADADDRDVLHLQRRVEVERRVPVGDTDQYDAHGPLLFVGPHGSARGPSVKGVM